MTIHYHESADVLRPETRDVHRALATLCEELEAIDWYQQRLDVTEDDELRALFEHNREEELEHAAMALEWLRRRLPDLDQQLAAYLFKEGPITKAAGAAVSENGQTTRGLGIGSLRAARKALEKGSS
jgi:uncharacterized protein